MGSGKSGQRRKGGWGGQMWKGLGRGKGVPKIPQFVRTSFMDDPLVVTFPHLSDSHE